ncbi:flagellar FliS family protein [Bordetella holmesii 35009]|nr:flagellar FliS family protein [Bordetella holmesii 35009]
MKQGLNLEAGGELALNLSELYDFVTRTLLRANLHADAAQLDVADRLLADLASAWESSVDPSPLAPRPERRLSLFCLLL